MSLGPTELIIILVIVIILFGVGRVSKVFGEMGSGIRAFKDGIEGKDEKSTSPAAEKPEDKPKDPQA
jgi:sec-independent protein translocase protein TatA